MSELDKALESETCEWRLSTSKPSWHRSSDDRETALRPGSYQIQGGFTYDPYCPGCGRRIEVKERDEDDGR